METTNKTLVFYDRYDLVALFKCSMRTAQRRFSKIYLSIPENLRKPEHKKSLPEYYVKKFYGIPSDK